MITPKTKNTEIIGVVGVEIDGKRQWSKDDVAILESVAERTALAVENARLIEQSQRSAERQDIINTISERLESAPDLQVLLESVVNELKETLGVDQVYVELTANPQQAANVDGGANGRVSGDPASDSADGGSHNGSEERASSDESGREKESR